MVFTLSSCAALKPASKVKETIPLTKDNLSMLDGSYEILSTDSSKITLDAGLTFDRYYIDRGNIKNRVILKIIDEKQILITIYDGSSTVRKKKVRGKIRNGYFECSLTRLKTFWLAFNSYGRQKNRIGILKNGDLTLDVKYKIFGFVVIFPSAFAGKENYNLVFRRI